MIKLQTLKKWLGLRPTPAQDPDHKTVTLPNGRTAVVDKQGNFVRFN